MNVEGDVSSGALLWVRKFCCPVARACGSHLSPDNDLSLRLTILTMGLDLKRKGKVILQTDKDGLHRGLSSCYRTFAVTVARTTG